MVLKGISNAASTMQEVNTASKKVKGETKAKAEGGVETKSEQSADASQDVFIKSADETHKTPYTKTKKLTNEQIQGLKEEQEASKMKMLQKMLDANIKNQANAYGLSQGSQDLLVEIFGSIDEAIPPLATTPEEAQKALEEGGAYSVEAVADRIMKMAEALGEGNPEKLEKLKSAVKEGFKQAGIDFEKQTESKLPQICLDTYDEVMKRFEALEQKQAESAE